MTDMLRVEIGDYVIVQRESGVVLVGRDGQLTSIAAAPGFPEQLVLLLAKEVHRARLLAAATEGAEPVAWVRDLDGTGSLHMCARGDDGAIALYERSDSAQGEIARLREALGKINAIRSSIVGTQSLNWSEHVYPLVAALNDAGFEGMSYPEGRAYFGTLIERVSQAEAARVEADKRAGQLEGLLNGVREHLGGGPALENMPGAARAVRDMLETAEAARDAAEKQVAVLVKAFTEAVQVDAKMSGPVYRVSNTRMARALELVASLPARAALMGAVVEAAKELAPELDKVPGLDMELWPLRDRFVATVAAWQAGEKEVGR